MRNLPRTSPAYTPRHRRDVEPVRHSTGFIVFDANNEAACKCRVSGWSTCPRHNPDTYADQQARHATDSLPVWDRAERFHNSNQWGV